MNGFGVDSCASVGFDSTAVRIEKPSVESILSKIDCGLGLDISKNSTGICLWRDNTVTLENFTIPEFDKEDSLKEARMRRELKEFLRPMVEGCNFDIVGIEDVYGGESFDTTRVLLALNTALDDLYLEGSFKCDEYIKTPNREWKKYFRNIVKIGKAPEDKLEIREIFRFLEFEFFLDNEDLRPVDKDRIGFQDKLDATGILCGLVLSKNSNIEVKKKRNVRLNDLIFNFAKSEIHLKAMTENQDLVVPYIDHAKFECGYKDIEKEFVQAFNDLDDLDMLLYTVIPVSRMANFAVRYDIPFLEQDNICIYAYRKQSKKKLKELFRG